MAKVLELVIFKFLIVDKLVSPLNISAIVVTFNKSLSELNSTEVNKGQSLNVLLKFETLLGILIYAVLKFVHPSK